LYASRLAEKQADVTGIDISIRSIRYAQEAAEKARLDIRYVNQNYLAYETDSRFDLIIMIFCDFCALNPEQRKIMLSKFSNMLKPSGSVLLDVHSLTAFAKREEKSIYEADLLDGFWSANKYYGFLNTIKYDEEKVVLDKYTIVEPARIRTVYNWLQYYSNDSLIHEFSENGFETESIYSDVAGRAFNLESDEIAIVAKKS
jgi:SAM-dependent methyltransferase